MTNRKRFAPAMVRRTSTSKRVGRISLPFVGRVTVYVIDGNAYLLPTGGGVVSVDWFVFCQFLRRRNMPMPDRKRGVLDEQS